MSLNIEEIVSNLETIAEEQFDGFQLRKILEEYTIAKMEMDRSSYLYDQNTDGSCIDEILDKVIAYIITYTKSSLSKFTKSIDMLDNTCFPDIQAHIEYIENHHQAEIVREMPRHDGSVRYTNGLFIWEFDKDIVEKFEEEADYPWQDSLISIDTSFGN